MISIQPTPHPDPVCSWKKLVLALQSRNHITMSVIFCLPYWDSFAFYLIISTTEPALTLSFQNHLRILFLDHFLESQAQGDLTRHFAGNSVILLSDVPSFLLVSTSFKNVCLPCSSSDDKFALENTKNKAVPSSCDEQYQSGWAKLCCSDK